MAAPSDRSRETLDESQFIRHQLHQGDESSFKRYARLTLATPGLLALFKYELIGLLGPVPGALGLALRKFAYRLLFADAGKGVVFGRSLTLRHADNVKLGENVVIDDYCLVDARGAGDVGIHLGDKVIVNRGAAIQAKVGHITIGPGTSVGAACQIISQGPIEIAENVSIAAGTLIAGGRYEVDLSPDDPDEKSRFTGGPIKIGANSRIGMRSIILDGVTLGRNAIVAPGSVVYDDVPDGTVVMGSPARPLRQRATAKRPAERPEPAHTSSHAGSPTASSGTAPDRPGAPSPHASPMDGSQSFQPVILEIRSYLAEMHGAEFGPGKLSDNDSLFDHGAIDSVGLVGLITMLEDHYGIELDDDDMVAEKLSTVEGLAGIVTDKLE